MTAYSDRPDIMAIGDSMYQGIRSLSFLPAMAKHSTPAQVAAAIDMPMTVPDLQQPLLFDLEAELRHGGLLHLLDHIRLRRSDTRDHHCQTPRSFEARDLTTTQPLAAQQRRDPLPQFLRGGINHSRRNLFAPDL